MISITMKKNQVIILLLIAIAGLGFGIVISRKTASREHTIASRVDLDRPLIVGLVSWPGFVGGPVANGGFKENSESIFTKKYGLPVRFVLVEDIDARGKAFAKGGPDGVDVVWTSIDFWANELPNFVNGGIDAAAFIQTDWSRGGDAIVAGESIKTIEDLRGKKIALTQFTPSHWLLETALRASHLSSTEQQTIRDNLVFTQDAPAARSIFVAGQVDAAVTWEPDVTQALKREHSHILTSTKDFPNIIADMLVAQKTFIKQHPKAIEALVRGWLDGVEEAKKNPDLTARILMDNEPLFRDLGFDATKKALSWAHWANLEDNATMFGLNGSVPLFDSVFAQAGIIWQSLKAIDKPLDPSIAKDDTILRKIYQKQ